jgi:hypothetical protein
MRNMGRLSKISETFGRSSPTLLAMTAESHPPWALRNGIAPAHLIRAALRTAALIDGYGSPVPAARSAYLLYPSDALYPPEDLRLGERLLLDCGLLREEGGYLNPTPGLLELVSLDDEAASAMVFERSVLATEARAVNSSDDRLDEAAEVAGELIHDPDRRQALLLALRQKHDHLRNEEMGLRGEEFVARYAREQLTELGREDLASEVRRLSEFSDQLGYDVVAPRLSGKRRLEVKTSGVQVDGIFHLFVSRQEVDWGLSDDDWALVACRANTGYEIRLIGWCRAAALEPYLPVDGVSGRWVSAELDLPETLFERGLPPPV